MGTKEKPMGGMMGVLIDEVIERQTDHLRRGMEAMKPKDHDGLCEGCGKKSNLRPYGAGGEWICFSCGRKDEEATDKRMRQVLFGEGLS